MEGSGDLRIVLVGKTGVGKSSTANSILGKNLLTTSCRANSDTATCEAVTNTVDGRKITVIDTPGYFSTECTDENLKPEISKCIVECSPGPHAFLIMLPVTRYTEEENKTVEEILKMFGEGALKYAVVLFTHGDQLENMTIQQFVDENDRLKTLVQKCGNRFHAIDNKYWKNPTEDSNDERSNATQIKKLLSTIDEMVKQNGGKHYTNEMLQAVEQAIKEEMAKGKTREKAKQSVLRRLFILTVGVTAGSLCGALLGLSACAGDVMLSVFAFTVATRVQTVATAGTRTRGVGAVASKVGMGLAVVAAVGASAGAITGGIIGANAVSEAETVGEAVERATAAVTDTAEAAAKTITKKMHELMKKP